MSNDSISGVAQNTPAWLTVSTSTTQAPNHSLSPTVSLFLSSILSSATPATPATSHNNNRVSSSNHYLKELIHLICTYLASSKKPTDTASTGAYWYGSTEPWSTNGTNSSACNSGYTKFARWCIPWWSWLVAGLLFFFITFASCMCIVYCCVVGGGGR